MAVGQHTHDLRLESPSETTPSDDENDDKRSYRARVEQMLVVPETNDENNCVGLYTVVSQSGEEYLVDLDSRESPCTCPDMQYNFPENGCKHRQRVQLMVESTALPAPDEPADKYDAVLDETLENVQARCLLLEQFLSVLKRTHD
jgi:hypothetical protein